MADTNANVIRYHAEPNETAVSALSKIDVKQKAFVPFEKCEIIKTGESTFERIPLQTSIDEKIDITLNTIPVGNGANGLVDSGIVVEVNLSVPTEETTTLVPSTQEMRITDPTGASKVTVNTAEGSTLEYGTTVFRVAGNVSTNTVIEHADGVNVGDSATIGNVHHVEAYGVHTAVKPVGSPFTKATRTFTIPANWQFHIAFEEFTAGALSVVFPNVSGDYVVALNVATKALSASTTFPSWGVGIPIARVWYSTIAGDEINMSWENHGIRTLNDHNDATAKHHTVGMLAEIQNRPLVVDGGQGTSVIGCTSGVLWDEDKKNTTSAKASGGTSAWAKFYFTGLTATGAFDLRRFPLDFGTATLAQIRKIYVTDVDLGVGATGRACFNNMSTGTPTMQAIASTSVMCIHLFQNDGILDTSALIIGQKEYTGSNIAQAVASARVGVASEIANIKMGEGAARDSVHVGTVIINASGQKQWADDAQTTTVVQPNQTGVSSGGTVVDHNSLTGRSSADAHPTSAITGLDTALAGKQPLATDLTNLVDFWTVESPASTITGIVGNKNVTVFNGQKDMWIANNLGRLNGTGSNYSVRAVDGYAGEIDFSSTDAVNMGILYSYGTGLANSVLGAYKRIFFRRDGSIKDEANYATKVATADGSILANFTDVKTLIGSAFTQMYSFGRVSFQMTGGNVDIPKVPVREADVTQTFALRSGAKAPLACKITGFNITFLTQPAEVNVYYKINSGAWILIGSVTVANGYATYLLGSPIQLAQNDFVRISYTGSNGESTGIDVDVFVREASL